MKSMKPIVPASLPSLLPSSDQQRPGDVSLPGPRPTVQADTVEMVVPHAIRKDLEANPHLIEAFLKTVHGAVQMSMNHPQTRPLVVSSATGDIVKERVEMVWKAAIIMRRDMNYTLHQVMDELPQGLMVALIENKRIEDVIEKETDKGKWDAHEGPEERVVDRAELEAGNLTGDGSGSGGEGEGKDKDVELDPDIMDTLEELDL